jgi:hypothetical protein
LVKADVGFPDGEAEVFQSGSAPDGLFTHAESVFAASEVSIHRGYKISDWSFSVNAGELLP